MKSSSLVRRGGDAPQCGDRGRGNSGRDESSTMAKRSMAALGLSICALILYGCSASASHGDVAGDHEAAKVSPEQCLTGGALMTANDPSNYHIQPGDDLSINFYLNPEFNDEVSVRPDGKITLRLIGAVPAAGLTPTQLAAQLDQAYLSELRSPDA